MADVFFQPGRKQKKCCMNKSESFLHVLLLGHMLPTDVKRGIGLIVKRGPMYISYDERDSLEGEIMGRYYGM